MKHRLASSLAVAALSLGAQSARSACAQTNAARSPWVAAADLGPHWHHDDSYQPLVLGTGPRPSGGLTFGRDLVHLGGLFTLAANASWRMENVSGNFRQTFPTTLVTNHLHADVTLRLELTRWLTPYARLAGGATNYQVTVRDPDATELTGSAWTPSAAAGLGATFTGGTWFDSLGLRTLRMTASLEGGYQLVAPTELRVAQAPSSDERTAEDTLRTQSVALGTLNSSSAYFRVVLGFRF